MRQFDTSAGFVAAWLYELATKLETDGDTADAVFTSFEIVLANESVEQDDGVAFTAEAGRLFGGAIAVLDEMRKQCDRYATPSL